MTKISYSLIDNEYKLTIGTPNSINIDVNIEINDNQQIIINEVSATNPEVIELKNITDKDVNLSNYHIKDKSGAEYKFDNIEIIANSYLILYGSDEKNIIENKIYLYQMYWVFLDHLYPLEYMDVSISS